MVDFTNQTVDAPVPADESSATVSWHDPHPIFVIVLVGKDEIPYGIQKDLLCAQSPYYRELFATQGEAQVEHLVKLPDTDAETFGCFQNFLYTGSVYDRNSGREIPDYPLLMGVWKLGTELKMAPLRTAVLNVMAERRQLTSAIPGTALLKQAWLETEEGSELRKLFIGWAAEHMRSSPDIRNTFAKSLPQEILSELVIVMSDLPPPSTPAYNTPYAPPAAKHGLPNNTLDAEQGRPVIKRARHSEATLVNRAADDAFEIKPIIKKPARKSEPASQKAKNRKGSRSVNGPIVMDPDRELAYCRDLIGRMLSGPGFWTRLVGPFREPVDPIVHNAPNYFDVVKHPMDLTTIHSKMARNEYANAQEFEADIRLIFQNCYEYWTQDDPVFKDCEKFEKYFNDKWDERHKWIPPHVKMEVID
ncbi:hypothetical protein BGZ60DRAFT_531224 [Tricladium varicosporioides]|nr:hypothetical protein BGZ60DRAFT_531224 [Hymenoscyphus varicosporioides]